MFAARQPVWGVTQGCKLLWKSWDGEFLVYNAGSGDTHILDPLSAQALKRLELSPATQQELQAHISQFGNAESSADAASFTELLLKQLHSLGVVEPIIV